MRPRVVMIGTSPAGKGGISSVVQGWIAAGLFERWNVEYVATHIDGSKARKALAMLSAMFAYTGVLLRPPAFVHVHLATRASFWRKLYFVALARARGVPVVLHVHGGHFAGYHRDAGPAKKALIRWALESARIVVALTAGWADTFRAIAPGATVAVVPNAVDLPRAPSAPRDPGTVLYLGRLHWEKGIDEMLEAFALVLQRQPRARLLLGGSGDEARVDAALARLGIAASVERLGWVGGAAKDALLDRAAVLALPSRVEGLPVGLLEAMAHGMPVVATRVGGVPDVVTDGVEGLTVPPRDAPALADALCALLDDPERAARMGAAGRARVAAQFETGAVMRQLDQLYATLLECAPQPERVA